MSTWGSKRQSDSFEVPQLVRGLPGPRSLSLCPLVLEHLLSEGAQATPLGLKTPQHAT